MKGKRIAKCVGRSVNPQVCKQASISFSPSSEQRASKDPSRVSTFAIIKICGDGTAFASRDKTPVFLP